MATASRDVDSRTLKKMVAYSDVVLALAVVLIVGMMVIPLPTRLVDLFMTISMRLP